MGLQRETSWYAETKLKRDIWKPNLMYYDVTVIENPAYEGIMTLPLNVIYFVASYWQVTRCALLWCDTNGSCCLQNDLVKAVTVSDTTCYITVLLIKAIWDPWPNLATAIQQQKFWLLAYISRDLSHLQWWLIKGWRKQLVKPFLTLKLIFAYDTDDLSWA